jgi:DNA invertase Pin-like site-specific DNA recombinase
MALVKARGWELVEVFEERASAYGRRPAFSAMMEAARRGLFRYCAVWSLDRLGRGLGAFDTYRQLSGQYGVTIASVREPWTEVEGPQRDLLCAVASWVAGYERSRLVERTLAGMARARREHRRIGRPPVVVDVQKALQLRAQGLGLRAVAKQLGCGATTISRVLKAAGVLTTSYEAGPMPRVAGYMHEKGSPESPPQPPEFTVAA